MATKLCYGCNQHLEANADNFHKHPKTKDGLTTRCKSCTNNTNRSKYGQNKMKKALDKAGKALEAMPYNQLEEALNKVSPETAKQYAQIERAIVANEEENLWD